MENKQLINFSSSDRNYKYQYQEPLFVLHRSTNRIIVLGQAQSLKPNLDGLLRGWKSPPTVPYRPIGSLQQVVPVIEELKSQLENSLELQAQSQKHINEIKRTTDNNLYAGGDDPQRTWNVISKGVVSMRKEDHDGQGRRMAQQKFGAAGKKKGGYLFNDPKEYIDLKLMAETDGNNIKDRMINLEKQFLKIPSHVLFQTQKVEQLDETEIKKISSFSNQRLYSPKLKKLMQKKDASLMLKDEIGESSLRLKAAKFGHTIEEIAPQYENSFYLPQKERFNKIGTGSKTPMTRRNPVNKITSQSQQQPNSPSASVQKYSPRVIQTADFGMRNRSFGLKNVEASDSVFMTQDETAATYSNRQTSNHLERLRDQVLNRTGTVSYNKITIHGFQENFCQPQKTPRQLEQENYQLQQFKRREHQDPMERSRVQRKALQQIKKLVPRKPQRLNEISDRFNLLHSNRTEYLDEPKTPLIDNDEDGINEEFAKTDRIQFISAIDSKPVHPSYLKLMDLQSFIKLTKAQKQNEQIGITANPSKKKGSDNPGIRSIDKTEYDEIIRSLKGCKMLDTELRNCIQKWVDDPLKIQRQRKTQLEHFQKNLKNLALSNTFQSEVEESPSLNDDQLSLTTQQIATAKYWDTQKQVLTQQQDILLRKLIYFDSLVMDNENDAIKHQLYELFFAWRNKEMMTVGGETRADPDDHDTLKSTSLSFGDQHQRSLAERIEKSKRAQLKREQAMQDFSDKGGFSKVLNDIFNPTDLKSLELDSVFQLKQFCKDFYDRKTKISQELVGTLDALNNERPGILKQKRKHFNIETYRNATRQEQMTFMRLGAEKARVDKFKLVAMQQTKSYYNILEQFLKILDQRKEKDALEEVAANQDTFRELDFQTITEKMESEVKLMATLQYCTEFMRQVIENGASFTTNHLFIWLLHLQPEQLNTDFAEFLNLVLQELNIEKPEFDKFIQGVSDENLFNAFQQVTFY